MRKHEAVTTIGVEKFAMIMEQKDVRLTDVRTPKEYAEGHLAGVENINVKVHDFTERIKDIKSTVAVYCHGGKRVKIHALVHSSICIEYDGRTIYVDPVAKQQERTVDYTVLP